MCHNVSKALGVVLVLDGAHVSMRVLVVGRHFHTALGCQLGSSTLSKVPALFHVVQVQPCNNHFKTLHIKQLIHNSSCISNKPMNQYEPMLNSQCSTKASKAHVREAPVGALGPWISWSLGVEVNAAVAQLADPAHQIAIGIGVSLATRKTETNDQRIEILDNPPCLDCVCCG